MVLWLVLIALVVVLDFATSNILFSWMSIGFLAAIFANNMGLSFPMQILIACIVGAIFFSIGSYLSKKYLQKNIERTPVYTEKLIGSTLTAEKDIEETSQLKVGGIYWNVVNDGPMVEKGDKFTIIEIRNGKLHIVKEGNID